MGLISETFGGFPLAIARYVHWLTVNPEEHRNEGELGLILPFPPTTNHLWRPVIRHRPNKERPWEEADYPSLEKTPEYEGWIIEAGYQPLAGRWCRFTEDWANKIPWGMVTVAAGLHYGRDASNTYKAVEDLVCAMTGLRDNYNRTPATFRLDLTKALKGEGLREGLYVLMEQGNDAG